uniref:Uncharacterized protein n=1 Tax=Heterorhabditis bacteriophora TaxID=37862 RepID=A0A1I7WU56_HETBA
MDSDHNINNIDDNVQQAYFQRITILQSPSDSDQASLMVKCLCLKRLETAVSTTRQLFCFHKRAQGSTVVNRISFFVTVDLHFLRQHMDLTDLIWVRSHLPHRSLVISEDLLLGHFSNARSVHGPGSSTPGMVLYRTKLLVSIDGPLNSRSRDTELLSNRDVSLLARASR